MAAEQSTFEAPREGTWACFYGENWKCALYVPWNLHPVARVADRCYLRPLLPLLQTHVPFFVLALSHSAAALYSATPLSIEEVHLPVLDGAPQPTSADEWRAAYERLDAAVALQVGRHAPLVLACPEHLAVLYRTANSTAQLLPQRIPGQPQGWSTAELRMRAWQIVEQNLGRQRRFALDQFHRWRHSDRANEDPAAIAVAAEAGRVASLFVNSANLPPIATTADDDLVNTMICDTLVHEGTVWLADPLEMEGAALAATLRWGTAES
jgi:hypothetical protein